MKMRVLGVVKEKESGNPLPGLLVCAFDKDLFSSDFLGRTVTGPDGRFTIEYDSKDFQELLDRNPDIFVEVYGGEYIKAKSLKRIRPIYTTKKSIRYSASSSEKYFIEIPKKKLG
jgi:hypothetical protein